MTFGDVFDWCRKQRADVRGVYRGHYVNISHGDAGLPSSLPALGQIFHWDVKIGDWKHYVSSSDMERMVTGKMTLDEFKGTLRRGE